MISVIKMPLISKMDWTPGRKRDIKQKVAVKDITYSTKMLIKVVLL
jgi:hypothetical protein